jgi:hypothetical protein
VSRTRIAIAEAFLADSGTKSDNALLQFAQLNTLESPDPDDLKHRRRWLERLGYGNGFLIGILEDV